MTSRRHDYNFDFRSGLDTVTAEQSENAIAFQTFQNSRATAKALQRRNGIARVAVMSPATTPMCGDFDGTNDFFTIVTDQRVWALGTMPNWTLKWLCNVDTLSSQRSLFGHAAAAPPLKAYQDSTSGGRVVVEVTDTSGVVSTLSVTGIAATTLTACMLTKSGPLTTPTVTLYVNGSTSSATMTHAVKSTSSLNLFVGKDNGGNFYDGKIDHLTLLKKTLTNQRDGWVRTINPYAQYVVADYVVDEDANTYILDRSRFGLHAAISGGLATNVASLAALPMPVQMIAPNRNGTTRQVIAIAGGRLYEGTI